MPSAKIAVCCTWQSHTWLVAMSRGVFHYGLNGSSREVGSHAQRRCLLHTRGSPYHHTCAIFDFTAQKSRILPHLDLPTSSLVATSYSSKAKRFRHPDLVLHGHTLLKCLRCPINVFQQAILVCFLASFVKRGLQWLQPSIYRCYKAAGQPFVCTDK